MRAGAILYFLTVLLGAGGCSSVDVSVDYDPKTDFSKFRFWTWSPPSDQPKAAPVTNARVSPFMLQRVRGAVEQVLAQKGYVESSVEKSDFLVNIHTTLERHIEVDPYGWGYRWGPYPWGPYYDGYWGPGAVYSYEVITLIIDVIESAPPRRIVWRGIAQTPAQFGLTREEEEERVKSAVNEVFSQFPPPKGTGPITKSP